MACGPWQIAIVVLVIVLIFGAKRLPEIARSLGRSASEFKRGQREGELLDQPPRQDAT